MCHSWKSLEILWKLAQTYHTPSGTVTLGRGGCQCEFLSCWQGRSYRHLGPPPPPRPGHGSKGLIT